MDSPASGTCGDVVLVTHVGTVAGQRIAHDLLARGYRVVVTGRHAAELVEVLHGHSARQVLAIAADFDDPAQVKRVVDRVLQRFGRIDSIIDAEDRHPPAAAAA